MRKDEIGIVGKFRLKIGKNRHPGSGRRTLHRSFSAFIVKIEMEMVLIAGRFA
jgi:hypothetical protein